MALTVQLFCVAEVVLPWLRGSAERRQLRELRAVPQLGKVGAYDQDESCDHCGLHWVGEARKGLEVYRALLGRGRRGVLHGE